MEKEKPIATNFSREQIEQLAELFARNTGYKSGQDIFEYVKSLGGKIEYSDEDIDSAGGAIDVSAPNSFIIYLSRATPPERDVFTIAHELGHFVLHSQLGAKQIKAGRSGSKETTEKEANSFAAGFLMPQSEVKDLYAKDPYIYGIADYFKVSLSAAEWRCRNLGLLQ